MGIFKKTTIKEKVIAHLKHVYDPEIPANIYDLGLIYGIEFEEIDNYLYCKILMTLTSPGCPVADALISEVKYVTQAVDEVDEAIVTITFDPPWDTSKMTEEAKDIMLASGVIIYDV